MSKRSDKEDRDQVTKAKPGFIPVAKTRGTREGPAAPVDSGTPDTAKLRSKSDELSSSAGKSDESGSADPLLKKFLPNKSSEEGEAGADRAEEEQPEPKSAKVKGKPRIVSVRPSQQPESDEGVPPKDLQMVMDDEGQVGETS